jgi:hypothetical protein
VLPRHQEDRDEDAADRVHHERRADDVGVPEHVEPQVEVDYG